MLFHTHAWCADARFEFHGQVWQECLYSEQHSFRTIEVDFGPEDRDLLITTGIACQHPAKAQQIWLAGLSFEQKQSWMSPSYPITDMCSLTHGKHGTYITLTTDTVIGASIVDTGVWAERDMEVFRTIVRPGMTVLDIGANIGHHTVAYSKIVGPNGRVIAFEPQRLIYQILNGNIAINGCQNTEAIRSCVGETLGFVNMFPISYSDRTNFGALGVAPDSHGSASVSGEQCRVAPLDTLLGELVSPISRCDFIKIDVQSFELFVLRGALKTLNLFKPTLFLEISPFWMSKFYDYREIYKLLWTAGYQVEHFGDPATATNTIKEWSGRETEEWDIIARPVG
jgi:FkbM family methyltransferase